jgi:hypothetical protein
MQNLTKHQVSSVSLIVVSFWLAVKWELEDQNFVMQMSPWFTNFLLLVISN